MYYHSGPQTIYCEILELEEGLYKTIVLRDLVNDAFLMLTVFPNWQGQIPEKGNIGYIEFEFVEAGKSKWYNKVDGNHVAFLNTYMMFKQYVPDSKNCTKNKITL